ncbi:hypothetical protein ACIBCL_29355 [Micromonospora zamorensis]|uniref:hypothetical protein n=1 Tax=Micromonospora zamorensis TaxID=709883 RepID=UPI0037A8FFB7
MPALVALALTLALAPTPSPSATSGPVADLLGGVGRIVDDLLDGGDPPSTAPTAPPTPSPTAVTDQPSPVRPTAAPTPAGSSAAVQVPAAPVAPARPAGGEVTGTREATVPRRDGPPPAPVTPPTLASPARDSWPPVSYVLVLAAMVVLAVWLLRRRPSAPAAAPAADLAPAPAPDPAPDPGPVPDNVSRLPTSLNAIYELGRLDERLAQERGRPT